VTNTTDYGAFVEIAPDVTGLVHISALSDEYVRRVTDVVKPGDPIKVEVLNIDDRGRYKLQRIVPDSEKKPVEDDVEDVEVPEGEGEREREQEEPVRAEAPQPTPAPDQPEPTQSEPAQPEPTQSEPVQPEPKQPTEPEADEELTPEPQQPEFEDRW